MTQIGRRDTFADTITFAERVREFGLIVPAVVVLLYAIAIVLAPDRRRRSCASAPASPSRRSSRSSRCWPRAPSARPDRGRRGHPRRRGRLGCSSATCRPPASRSRRRHHPRRGRRRRAAVRGRPAKAEAPSARADHRPARADGRAAGARRGAPRREHPPRRRPDVRRRGGDGDRRRRNLFFATSEILSVVTTPPPAVEERARRRSRLGGPVSRGRFAAIAGAAALLVLGARSQPPRVLRTACLGRARRPAGALLQRLPRADRPHQRGRGGHPRTTRWPRPTARAGCSPPPRDMESSSSSASAFLIDFAYKGEGTSRVRTDLRGRSQDKLRRPARRHGNRGGRAAGRQPGLQRAPAGRAQVYLCHILCGSTTHRCRRPCGSCARAWTADRAVVADRVEDYVEPRGHHEGVRRRA